MPQPTSQAELRPDLVTFEELDTEMQLRGYVATQIMRPFEVPLASGEFDVIELKSLLANANADTKRSSSGGYNGGDYTFEERSFRTKEHGWEEKIDDRMQNMYTNLFDMEEVATYRCWEHLLNGLEGRVIALLGTLISASQSANATQLWSNLANATPIDDVEAAARAAYNRTGIWPDTVTMSRIAYRNCRRTAQVQDAFQSGGAGERTLPRDIALSKLAEAFDVRQVIVSDSIKNTANRGLAASITSHWPNERVLVSKAAQTNDFAEPCLGRIFHWGGDGSVVGADERMIGVVEKYRNEGVRGDIIRARHETSEFVLYQECAQVITQVT